MNGKCAVAFMMTLAMSILEHYTFSPMFLRLAQRLRQGAVGLDTGASNGIRNGYYYEWLASGVKYIVPVAKYLETKRGALQAKGAPFPLASRSRVTRDSALP